MGRETQRPRSATSRRARARPRDRLRHPEVRRRAQRDQCARPAQDRTELSRREGRRHLFARVQWIRIDIEAEPPQPLRVLRPGFAHLAKLPREGPLRRDEGFLRFARKTLQDARSRRLHARGSIDPDRVELALVTALQVGVDVRAVRATHLHPDPSPAAREEGADEDQSHLVLLLDVVIGFTQEYDSFRSDRVQPRSATRVAVEIDGKTVSLHPSDAPLGREGGVLREDRRRRRAARDGANGEAERDRSTMGHRTPTVPSPSRRLLGERGLKS